MPDAQGKIAVDLQLVDKFTKVLEKFSSESKQAAKAHDAIGDSSTKNSSMVAWGMAKATMAIEGAKMAYNALSGLMRDGIADAMAAERANIALGDSQARLAPYLEQLADRLNTSDDAMKRGAATMLKTGMVTDDFVEKVMKGLPAFDALGIGVEQGSDIIASALMGATSGLKQFGMELDEGASRQDVIDALIAKFGSMEGAAVKLADSSTGKIKGMAEAWGEVKESMGTEFLKAFTSSEDGIKGMEEAMKRLGKAAGESLSYIVKSLDYIVDKTQKLGTSYGDFWTGGSKARQSEDIEANADEENRQRWRAMRAKVSADPNSDTAKVEKFAAFESEWNSIVEDTITASEDAQMKVYDAWQAEWDAIVEEFAGSTVQYATQAAIDSDAAKAATESHKQLTVAIEKGSTAAGEMAQEVDKSVQAMASALGGGPRTAGGQKSADREEKRAEEDMRNAGKAKNRAEKYAEQGDMEKFEKEMKRSERLQKQSEEHSSRANPELAAFKKNTANQDAAEKIAKGITGGEKNLEGIESGIEKWGRRLESIEKKVNAIAGKK